MYESDGREEYPIQHNASGILDICEGAGEGRGYGHDAHPFSTNDYFTEGVRTALSSYFHTGCADHSSSFCSSLVCQAQI